MPGWTLGPDGSRLVMLQAVKVGEKFLGGAETNKKRLAAATILVLAIMFTSVGCKSEIQVTETQFLMDTIVELTIYGANKQEAGAFSNEVFAKMRRLEEIFDKNNPAGDISRINAAAGRDWVDVEPETIFVLQQALEIAQKTGGAFDPTVGPLLELWGFGTEHARVPADEELQKALALIDYTAVEVDQTAQKVFLPHNGMKLDLGGIAKGFIIDEGQKVMKQFPVAASLLNAGGDIGISGLNPSGGKWKIAVQDPQEPQQWLAILELEEGGVATSGGYQRYFEEKGQRYHHLLDPREGMPSRGISSVTIIAPDAMQADALATAIFVLGKEKGLAYIENSPGLEGLLVDEEGEIFISSGLRDHSEIIVRD
jgi:thiamine biosynthesis lipoprotein